MALESQSQKKNNLHHHGHGLGVFGDVYSIMKEIEMDLDLRFQLPHLALPPVSHCFLHLICEGFFFDS